MSIGRFLKEKSFYVILLLATSSPQFSAQKVAPPPLLLPSLSRRFNAKYVSCCKTPPNAAILKIPNSEQE